MRKYPYIVSDIKPLVHSPDIKTTFLLIWTFRSKISDFHLSLTSLSRIPLLWLSPIEGISIVSNNNAVYYLLLMFIFLITKNSVQKML